MPQSVAVFTHSSFFFRENSLTIFDCFNCVYNQCFDADLAGSCWFDIAVIAAG